MGGPRPSPDLHRRAASTPRHIAPTLGTLRRLLLLPGVLPSPHSCLHHLIHSTSLAACVVVSSTAVSAAVAVTAPSARGQLGGLGQICGPRARPVADAAYRGKRATSLRGHGPEAGCRPKGRLSLFLFLYLIKYLEKFI
jgi:hypothetical protein